MAGMALLKYYVVIISLIGNCRTETLDSKVDRLANILSLLDSKLSLDIIGLRQDIVDLRKSVAEITQNNVCTCLLCGIQSILRGILHTDASKPVFGVSDIMRFKPACSATENS